MATITEDYVSFETAKLLKEKGFDEGCSFVVNVISKAMMPVSWPTTNSDIEDEKASLIALPTLQMAMKWLRLMYHIHIRLVDSTDESYRYEIYPRKGKYNSVCFTDSCYYETYEKAAEVAIKYCLENLI